jgi:RHS repeat-associated protein
VGFTGHEGDDDLGLINMRGRIYDPKLGRFLQVDPVVSAPHFGQSWNPYSYVRNSPLNFVDPSGFQEAEKPPAGCDPTCARKPDGTWWRTSVTIEEAAGGGQVTRTVEIQVKDSGRDDLRAGGAGGASASEERAKMIDDDWRRFGTGGAPPAGHFLTTRDGHLLGVEQVMYADAARSLVVGGFRLVVLAKEAGRVGGAGLEAAAVKALTERGEIVVHTKIGEAGFDSVSIKVGADGKVQTIINEVKDVKGAVRVGECTALGCGKTLQWTERGPYSPTLDRNIKVAVEQLKKATDLSDEVRKAAIAQLESRTATIRLLGSVAKGTEFSPRLVSAIEEVTGMRVGGSSLLTAAPTVRPAGAGVLLPGMILGQAKSKE